MERGPRPPSPLCRSDPAMRTSIKACRSALAVRGDGGYPHGAYRERSMCTDVAVLEFRGQGAKSARFTPGTN